MGVTFQSYDSIISISKKYIYNRRIRHIDDTIDLEVNFNIMQYKEQSKFIASCFSWFICKSHGIQTYIALASIVSKHTSIL